MVKLGQEVPETITEMLVAMPGDPEQLETTLRAFHELMEHRRPWHFHRIVRSIIWELLRQHRQFIREWTEFFKALDDRFKKVYKDKATTAVEGMVGTRVGIEVLRLEKEYKQLTQGNPLPVSMPRTPEQLIIRAFEITRQQVGVLALAYDQIDADRAAAIVQSQQYVEFTRLMGLPRDFVIFLKEHFPNTFTEEAARGIPHTRIAEQIMLKLKAGQPVS